ncbi:DUF456 domain-containing protein [Aerosakkonema funiforme]|uniref:DUF456 domain-containing protein n=1 Tax=Aerosakkonema funiforme FACHB-1375 TaxID=2949571 RepID=A0A926V9E8_9CYAN|nr:DUF456 domain-containing protein [Aerosakkonema funiforme]MBD2179713.1 DUF456 domain-containing protein [Aerosakkonema funiforme FACHB-1375]
MQILYWLLVLVMVVGVIGAIVPGIPGSSLIVIGVVIWGLVNGFTTGVYWALGVSLVVFLLSIGIDYLAAYLGAKRAGASNWAQIGAIVGLILATLGLLPALPFGGPIIGILFGPLLGAIIGEFLYQRELETSLRLKQAFRAGIGIVVGSVVGRLIQGILAIAAVIVFLWQTLPQLIAGY